MTKHETILDDIKTAKWAINTHTCKNEKEGWIKRLKRLEEEKDLFEIEMKKREQNMIQPTKLIEV